MTFAKACKFAKANAKANAKWMYVWEESEFPGELDYSAGDDFDADTWFVGNEPVIAFGPDGLSD